MIKITQYDKTTKYAENDKEYIDSLFTTGGTLALFHKIQKRKHETLYFITENNGFFKRIDGLWGQFGKLDNGRFFFQWTTAQIEQ